MWKRRVIQAFAILTLGDGLIEFLAPREHSRLWVVGPQSTRRIGMWFVEKPDRMRVLGAAQVVLERVMNSGENRIEMRIPRSGWFLHDLRFPHS